MNRRDVIRISEELARISGLNEESVRSWVWEVCRCKGTRPGCIPFKAVPGKCYVEGEADRNSIEIYTPPTPWEAPYNGPDYEDMILARQERWD